MFPRIHPRDQAGKGVRRSPQRGFRRQAAEERQTAREERAAQRALLAFFGGFGGFRAGASFFSDRHLAAGADRSYKRPAPTMRNRILSVIVVLGVFLGILLWAHAYFAHRLLVAPQL